MKERFKKFYPKYSWVEDTVCFDCECGAKELIVNPDCADGIVVCDCGRQYKLVQFLLKKETPKQIDLFPKEE